MCSSLSSVQVRGGNGTLNKCNALRYDLVGSNFRGHLGDLRQHVPLAADAILRFHRRFEIANPVAAQWETSNNWSYQDQSFANPLLCGRTARRGATLFLEQRAKAVPAQTAL